MYYFENFLIEERLNIALRQDAQRHISRKRKVKTKRRATKKSPWGHTQQSVVFLQPTILVSVCVSTSQIYSINRLLTHPVLTFLGANLSAHPYAMD